MAQFQDVDDNWHCRYHHYIYNCRFNCLFITTLYHIYTVSQLRLLLLLYCTYTFIALQIIFLFSILQPKQNTSKTYIFVYFWNFGKSWKFQILASSELKAQFHFMLHTHSFICTSIFHLLAPAQSIYIAIFARILILTVCLTLSKHFNKFMSKILKL